MKSIIILILIMQSCSINSDKNQKVVEIEGKAQNLKLGAVVQNKNGDNYFIDKLSYWEANMIGRDIVVNGYIIEIEHKQIDSSNQLISQKVGDGNWTQKIIKNAKWKFR